MNSICFLILDQTAREVDIGWSRWRRNSLFPIPDGNQGI